MLRLRIEKEKRLSVLRAEVDELHDRMALKLRAYLYAKLENEMPPKFAGCDALTLRKHVVGANFKGRQYPQDGASTETGSATDFALTIINYSPIVQAAGGERAQVRAMQGEPRCFFVNLEKGLFRRWRAACKSIRRFSPDAVSGVSRLQLRYIHR